MNAKSDLLFRRFSRMYDSFFEFGIGPPNVEWQLTIRAANLLLLYDRRTMTEEAFKATTLSDPENRSVQEGRWPFWIGWRRHGSLPILSLVHRHSFYQTRRGADPSSRRRLTAEAKYQALVEQIPAVTFMAPLDGSTSELYVSPQIEICSASRRRNGWKTRSFGIGNSIPTTSSGGRNSLPGTVNSGVPFRADYRFIAHDGRVVWVHGEAKLLRRRRRAPLPARRGVQYTEIKQAENEFRQFHLLVSSVQDYAIYSIDPTATCSPGIKGPSGSKATEEATK